MKTIGLAAWKGDVSKHFLWRMNHLLAKPGIDQWLWAIRDTPDMTKMTLEEIARLSGRVTVLVEDWKPHPDRILHLSCLGDYAISEALKAGATRVFIHESDLITPLDVVERLAATPGAVVGGWPVLANMDTPEDLMLFPGALRMEGGLFYDSWAYRKGGVRYLNKAPYHPEHDTSKPYQLDSVGSVALIDAEYLRRGCRMFPSGFVGLCDAIRGIGGSVWCDPTVPVVQPVELWTINND